MIGKKLLQYEILEKLGSGGMGEVYRAHDTGRLDRDVALKVLPERLASDPERLKRFEREAAVVAGINHPNIVTIYTIEEAEGLHFITMELVEGLTLSELLRPDGMELDRFFDIAVPLADAISAAHAKGVAHRDLKPANIMVDESGRVKVLDFGLAKLVESVSESDKTVGADSDTAEGRVMGTASYMSPEQAEGSGVDHRTDAFSLGIILYEMVTGERPFKGKSSISTLSSILKDTPPSVTDVRRALPTHLARIVNRCLEKNPDDRYQHVLDLRNDLKGLRDELSSGSFEARSVPAANAPHSQQTAAPPLHADSGAQQPVSDVSGPSLSGDSSPDVPKRKGVSGKLVTFIAIPVVAALLVFGIMKMGGDGDDAPGTTGATGSAEVGKTSTGPTKIVVLPFENLGSPDDEYFADGITDEITSRLAVIPGIAVISRTTARKYKATDKEMKDIGRELDVAYVLEGTIRWDNRGEVDRVRITPQLINVADDVNVWAQNYERQIDEIFTVQEDIATQIADALGVTLLEGDRAALATRPTENMEAYQNYLRGVAIISEGDMSRSEVEAAIGLLGRAIDLDPAFADAYAWVSRAHSAMVHWGHDRSETRLAAARENADRALELDPHLVNAHVALGFYHYWGRKDYGPALKAAARALEIQDDFVPALELKAWSLRRMGRLDEAVAIMQRILEYSPGSSVTMRDIGDTYTFLRRYGEAIRYSELSILAEPNQFTGYQQCASVLRLQGDVAGARKRLQAMPELPVSTFTRVGWFPQYVQERNAGDLLTLGRGNPKGIFVAQNTIVTAGEMLGLAYTFLDEPDRAREAYETAVAPLDSAITADPSDYRAYMSIGRVYAGLGRREAAVRNGERGYALYNPTVDAMSGQYVAEDLAIIYAMSGESEKAFEMIEQLLTTPAEYSIETVKQDPRYDGLRQHPQYAELLGKFGG